MDLAIPGAQRRSSYQNQHRWHHAAGQSCSGMEMLDLMLHKSKPVFVVLTCTKLHEYMFWESDAASQAGDAMNS